MGTRPTRTLTSLAFRCLRRQLHSALGSGKHPLLSPGSSTLLSSSPVTTSSYGQGQIDGVEPEQDLWHLKMMQLDPEATSCDLSRKLFVKNPIASLLQSAAPSQGRLADEWSMDGLSGRVSRVQHFTGDGITEGHSEEAFFVRDQDFLSRYLQWRSYDRSVCSPESRNWSDVVVGAVNAVDVDGIVSPSRPNCQSWSGPRLQQFSSLLNFYQEPCMIIPLEADSVKRKRKKKMNKHKQRKLRRRDRHRK